MAAKIKVYQKPTCTKCRQTLNILKDRGADFEAVDYYETPLDPAELKKLLAKLDMKARDILRKDEPVYRELRLATRDVPEDELIKLMIEHPDLIQRPIVVRGDKAVLGRPPENVEKLL
jgi:arsenate reductase